MPSAVCSDVFCMPGSFFCGFFWNGARGFWAALPAAGAAGFHCCWPFMPRALPVLLCGWAPALTVCGCRFAAAGSLLTAAFAGCRGLPFITTGVSCTPSAKYSSKFLRLFFCVNSSKTTSSSFSSSAVICFFSSPVYFFIVSITSLFGTFRSPATSCTLYFIIIIKHSSSILRAKREQPVCEPYVVHRNHPCLFTDRLFKAVHSDAGPEHFYAVFFRK